jgi:hypothetical protein
MGARATLLSLTWPRRPGSPGVQLPAGKSVERAVVCLGLGWSHELLLGGPRIDHQDRQHPRPTTPHRSRLAHRARYLVGKTMRDRWELASPAARARGDAGNQRLHQRLDPFNECRKRHVIANVAIARELAGWCWSLAVHAAGERNGYANGPCGPTVSPAGRGLAVPRSTSAHRRLMSSNVGSSEWASC